MYNKDFCDLHKSPRIVTVVKSRLLWLAMYLRWWNVHKKLVSGKWSLKTKKEFGDNIPRDLSKVGYEDGRWMEPAQGFRIVCS